MSLIRLLLLLGILSLSFESSCRINQQQGECSYIGECEGTQILSECGDGYGCCLSKSLNLLEEYKDFGLFSTIWEKSKIGSQSSKLIFTLTSTSTFILKGPSWVEIKD